MCVYIYTPTFNPFLQSSFLFLLLFYEKSAPFQLKIAFRRYFFPWKIKKSVFIQPSAKFSLAQSFSPSFTLSFENHLRIFSLKPAT